MENWMSFSGKGPEHFLEVINSSRKGNFKLFIGSAPGVGKTYRMLQEANELRKEGKDVVIGLVETHGRSETQKVIMDLEEIPLKGIVYKGKEFFELDVDAIVKRRPEIVLIDELAHTNIPGSYNSKRYQDVEDILNEGISVYSAVNIQHLESLHENVQLISGIGVRERIPDRILQLADEVILVDISPETLQKRMIEGKIYSKDKVEQAISNFFTMQKLAALRELSLREIANNIDDKILKEMEKSGETGPTWASEKILVCIGYGPTAEILMRRGWRMANRLKAGLYILHVNKSTSSKEQIEKIRFWKQLADQFDAIFIQKEKDRKVAKIITDVAKEFGITNIILGQSARTRSEEIIKGSIVNVIMRELNQIDIHIVPTPKS
ncbi:sensor histidine kinase KdpD [Salipaludibacillus agaradhaerens]|jgi:two-component system sensor histidine kinase KdpD|uniref:Sensor histidine kinase KdpD n=1 Tax=Salipaludibacillus agaradhaerens TaxID=76935 RepID=A0A9Q4FWF7_SALAG|nr:KdpD-like non-kinase potassium sensor [Salipaludibacillus agaradhaerens]MCR6096135.1 sensor histidine kinase KdpD [Salipaludibacillus agaradhaerens]MCR6114306.1 sensor histidine kinase KdpD [Salipaludibacillus agaradhaerens]